MTAKIAIPTPDVSDSALTQIKTPAAIISGNYDMSVAGMFMDADIVVKLVIIMLLVASIYSWAIIFNKLNKFWVINKRMTEFEQDFWSFDSFIKYYEWVKLKADNPLSKVFVAGMYEWLQSKESNATNHTKIDKPSRERTRISKRVFHAMDIARNREISACTKNLGFLATVGSTAPFIGLFGTVWGIMNAFQAISATKDTTLAVVAPGIAEALFATAIGLFAAIPAVIFYNKFNNNVANFADRIDEFSDEFGAVVVREEE